MIVISERGYFSLRYAIPGYTLILLVIGINLNPLLHIKPIVGNIPAFGVFLTFLLSGSAIGFLVTQVYWWRFQRKVGILGVDKLKKPMISALATTFNLDEKKLLAICCEDEKRKLLAVLDYISHSDKRKSLHTLVERRWDMYHLLASTEHTIYIGTIFGGITRVIDGHLLSKSCGIPDLILIPIAISVFILLLSLNKSKFWVLTELAHLSEARIRTSELTVKELDTAFIDLTNKYGKY